jgi:quinol-cytochrome oxidoreductase complex cytochrome b subunit
LPNPKRRLANFVLHVHPAVIPLHAVRPGFTWCMGGITSLLFLVEALTGVLLMFYYRPTVQWAYHDVLDLRDVVSLGVVREIHRWGGHAMRWR